MNDPKYFHPGKKSIATILPFLVVMVLVLSCTIFRPVETPTPTLTNTPEATDTPLPSDTPEPTATKKPTVNKAATQRANEEKTSAAQTEFASAVLGEVESKLDDVGEIMGYGSVIWLYPAPIEVDSSKPNMIYYHSIDSSIQAGDFAFHSIVKWETKQKVGLVNCVIMFRIGDDISLDPMYMMRMGRISGFPHVWFELYDGWNYIAGSNGRASNYIHDEGGAENEVILVARGTQFNAYVNGHQIEVWWNSKQDYGGFALGTWQDTGGSTCTFRDNWIWEWA